jgi:hypothetical protein
MDEPGFNDGGGRRQTSRTSHAPDNSRPGVDRNLFWLHNAHCCASPASASAICRRTRRSGRAILATLSLVLIVAGCVTPIPGARPDLLTFLKEGQTKREEVIVTLGQPSGTFERDRILTYRVGHDSGQGYFIISPKEVEPWLFVHYSLVLVFDELGVLRTQRLVDVQ